MKGINTVLGVSVGRSHYDGVLLESSGDSFVVVERFSAPRHEEDLISPEFGTASDAVESLPGVTVQLDTSPGASESTEFAGTADIGSEVGPVRQREPEAMDRVLQVWLSRARQLGYDQVEMAISIAEPDIRIHAVGGKPAAEPASGRGPLTWAHRRSLLSQLHQDLSTKPDAQRTGFLRLAPDAPEGSDLALMDSSVGPAQMALQKLADSKWRRHVRPTRIDADVALYGAVIRRNIDPDELTHSALVRVGVEDTQIIFFRRGHILSQERVPTITVFTEPRTVASRILLLQDSLRIPEIGDLIVIDDTPEQQFLTTFRMEFEGTSVREFSELITNLRFEKRTPRGVVSAGQWLAIGAAWVAAQEDPNVPARTDENLLPRSLRRRFESIAATAWHTWVAIGALLLVVVGQGYRYVSIRQELEEMEQEFARVIGVELQGGQTIEEMRALLTQRLDSLRAAQQLAQRSVRFMDSLSTGAERWTHFITHLGAASQSEQGMWFTVLEPVAGQPVQHVRLEGFAFEQVQVARLSRELDATIEFMAVSNEGGRRLFTFLLTAPVPNVDSPAKAYIKQWIREQVMLAADSSSVSGAAS
jgi:hypothetical protein